MFNRPWAPGSGAKGQAQGLAWIEVARHAPYFVSADGRDWTPIGQNDSVSWEGLSGLHWPPAAISSACGITVSPSSG
jgi:hypothetical protein